MKKALSALFASAIITSSLTFTALADVTMYSADGRTISVPESSVAAYEAVSWYTAPPVTMYSADGRTIMVSGDKVEAYKAVHWYTAPPVTMYSEDGRTITVSGDEVEAYKAVHWYTAPPVRMYSADGRNIMVSGNDVEAFKAVGWYTSPPVTMYAADGRTILVSGNDVEAYKNVGWYTEPQTEAQRNGHSQTAQSFAAGTELSSEQIYAKCSPAVFYLEVYNTKGYATGSGSGFFIDSNGTAVTNYHVIEDAATAKIQLPGSTIMYNVEGVYDYDKDNDWAVIKVAYSSDTYLSIGDPSTAVGGAHIYTIGSPEGFQNTISQGIISNPARVEDGITYIQITAPISHGSSGGALINKYGQVIGITSAAYSEGQNLNFAIPVSVISGYSRYSVTALRDLGKPAYSTPTYIPAYTPSYTAPSTVYIPYYSNFYGIPDFGRVTGATFKTTSSNSEAYGYFYYPTFHSDMIDVYIEALEACGFFYEQTYTDSYGYSHAVFTNYKLNYCVHIGINGYTKTFRVMITRP